MHVTPPSTRSRAAIAWNCRESIIMEDPASDPRSTSDLFEAALSSDEDVMLAAEARFTSEDRLKYSTGRSNSSGPTMR